MSADVPVAWRVPLLVLAFASLFAGVTAGLARLGWPFPFPVAELASLHGPLMASDTASNTARSAGPSGFSRPEPS